jgi:hypothetical protein
MYVIMRLVCFRLNLSAQLKQESTWAGITGTRNCYEKLEENLYSPVSVVLSFFSNPHVDPKSFDPNEQNSIQASDVSCTPLQSAMVPSSTFTRRSSTSMRTDVL